MPYRTHYCCVLCLQVWILQMTIAQAHRRSDLFLSHSSLLNVCRECKKKWLSENQTCVAKKKCITTCHTVPLMPLHHNSGYWLKYYIECLILHMPRHQLYSLGHAPMGKWPHGLTPKITFCDICTTCSNLAWERHVWQVVPVIHTIKRSVKLRLNLRKSWTTGNESGWHWHHISLTDLWTVSSQVLWQSSHETSHTTEHSVSDHKPPCILLLTEFIFILYPD